MRWYRFFSKLSQWHMVHHLLSNKCAQQMLNSVSLVVECWTLLNRNELESILFNKLPYVEQRRPIAFEFGVTGGKLQHGGWSLWREHWTLYEKFPFLYDVRWKDYQKPRAQRQTSVSALLPFLSLSFQFFWPTSHNYSNNPHSAKR